jgi:hypothetical protein
MNFQTRIALLLLLLATLTSAQCWIEITVERLENRRARSLTSGDDWKGYILNRSCLDFSSPPADASYLYTDVRQS